ncbi:hypothetical protein SAMN04488057_105204 [Cyclobacterium lianum]|uniref:Outer membrane protein beta-barrel domain-containing protein n=1 Tax=Cyclobacterium lianum TaxID=388280 RepID=A0A1M7NC73_9BACT|nr:DUF3575 domain-containing protein [Cyclobacterium lianum]SHN01292.1 hypothetical protein SAMN04488057_105204 [Cyclobacterium lianum]
MKKNIHILVILAMAGVGFQPAFSQNLPEPGRADNEVKINIVNTIVIGSLELGYERFLDQNQSLGLELMFLDRFSYVSDSGEGEEFNATSFMLSYNYYFVTPSDPSGFYVLPFLKYRNGTFTETGANDQLIQTDLNSFMIGFGAGYKWVHNDKFALGPYVNIARGFNSAVSDRFDPVEFNAGFSIGFRF